MILFCDSSDTKESAYSGGPWGHKELDMTE